jgi:hypothetical protein
MRLSSLLSCQTWQLCSRRVLNNSKASMAGRRDEEKTLVPGEPTEVGGQGREGEARPDGSSPS